METDKPMPFSPAGLSYLQGRLWSFVFAFRGLRFFFRTGANARIQLLLFGVMIAAAVVLGVTALECVALLLLSGSVFAAEMVNTCLELLLDHLAPGFHPVVGRIKDLAAGAVLLLSAVALAGGLLIFLPKILS